MARLSDEELGRMHAHAVGLHAQDLIRVRASDVRALLAEAREARQRDVGVIRTAVEMIARGDYETAAELAKKRDRAASAMLGALEWCEIILGGSPETSDWEATRKATYAAIAAARAAGITPSPPESPSPAGRPPEGS